MSSEEDIAFEDVKTEFDLPEEFLKDKYEKSKEEDGSWEDSWLYNEYQRRKRIGRDVVIGIIAENAARGVGKTQLGVSLCKRLDKNGFTAEKIAIDEEKIFELLDKEDGVDYNSSILIDEIQKISDSRRSMSEVNVMLSKAISMARFREAYLVYTLPSWGMLDKRVKSMTSILIRCSEDQIGEARVYEVNERDMDNGGIQTPFREEITWNPIDDDPIYKRLEEEKEKAFAEVVDLDDDDGKSEDQIRREEIKEEAKKKAQQIYSEEGLSYDELNEDDRVPDSPHSDSGNWSKQTLSKWLSHINKGSS
jgi:hypothetical protein